MLKQFEVDRSLFFGVFQELSLCIKKKLATTFTRHEVLQVKNKRFSLVILCKEVKQHWKLERAFQISWKKKQTDIPVGG